MIERQTAKKVSIFSLTHGKWVKKEGMEPSYIVTDYGEEVARARVLGTVVGKFVSEDENFASLTLDDGTDTIRAKTFKTAKPLDTVNEGDLVDVIGKVREWNGEIYIIPEIVHKVDPNTELLRRLEIASKSRSFTSGRQPAEKEDLRKKILEIVGKEKDGISYDLLIQKSGKGEKEVEKVVNDILAEGICYEPTPGKIKRI
jgi:RPA family protein